MNLEKRRELFEGKDWMELEINEKAFCLFEKAIILLHEVSISDDEFAQYRSVLFSMARNSIDTPLEYGVATKRDYLHYHNVVLNNFRNLVERFDHHEFENMFLSLYHDFRFLYVRWYWEMYPRDTQEHEQNFAQKFKFDLHLRAPN